MASLGSMFGSVSSLLGGSGGAGGTGFAAPTGVSPDQLAKAYQDQQAALKQQQDFVNAVQAQRGLQNQSQVFGQLSDISQGRGPNPAQAMLNRQTGQNVRQQAATQASQRGSSANAGLIARQAAQTGADMQQNTAGQAAQLQAAQALNAVNSMGNLANAQVQQQQSALSGLNQYGLQAQGNLLGMQGNVNSGNVSLAGTRMGQQPNALNGLGSAIAGPGSSMVSNLMGSGAGDSLATSAGPMMAGGAGDAISGAADVGTAVAADGGTVDNLPTVESKDVAPEKMSGPSSFVGRYFTDTPMQAATTAAPMAAASNMSGVPSTGGGLGGSYNQIEQLNPSYAFSKFTNPGKVNNAAIGALGMAKGGKVPALVSPGEQYLPPKDVKEVKKGKDPLSVGKKIPGTPKYPGNDYRNDIVPAKLEEGGIVIPNAILQSPNPHWAAMKFVHQTMKRSKNGQK